MTFWSHYVQTLSGNASDNAQRDIPVFHVPAGSTLLRTIVDVAVSEQRVWTPADGQPPFFPILWALGDINSDVSPHLDSHPFAGDTDGIPLIAHGMVAIEVDSFIRITDYSADTTNPGFPLHGSITGEPATEITSYLTGRDHVESQGQRTFPSGNPHLFLTIRNVSFGFPYTGTVPRTIFSIRTLWNHGSL